MHPHASGLATQVFDPDHLIANNHHLIIGRVITVLSGQTLTRGALIGKDATDKYALSLAGDSNGTQTPDAILAEDVDASAGDTPALAYFRGDFNANRVTLGTGHTLASVAEGLRAKGIVLLPSVPA